MRIQVIFFDINETLLNLTTLNSSIANALGGRPDLVPLWFSNVLHHSVVESVTGQFHTFGEIGVAALKMVAQNRNIMLTDEQAKEAILTPITQLPPHEDVIAGLNALKTQGFKLVALSNSSIAGLSAQLEFAQLSTLFDHQISVESVGKYKPLPEVYEWATKKLDVTVKHSLMVAAHHWDLMGAQKAGLNTAFVNRPGKTLYSLGMQPHIIANDLVHLSESLSEYSMTQANAEVC